MITILLMTICFCFLVEMLLLGVCSWGIAVCVMCGLLEAFYILSLKKPELVLRYKKYVVVGGTFVLVIVMLMASRDDRESYVLIYADELEEVAALIDEDRTKEALQELSVMQEKYGLRDTIVLERVLCYMTDSNYEAALQAVSDYSDKESQNYYSLLESIYLGMEDEGKEELYNLYIEAANKYPGWMEMQLAAGIAQLDRKEYSSAEYYFTRSYNMNMVDGMSAFYLGATAYYAGNYEECLYYFNDAIRKGVPDDALEMIRSCVVIRQESE